MGTKTSPALKALTAAILLCAAGQPHAESSNVIAYVNRVLLTADDSFGGCMASLSYSTRDLGTWMGCTPGWVSFSCSGDFNSPVRAYRMLDLAELALATRKKVQVWFDDAAMHNGYCFANRIEIIR